MKEELEENFLKLFKGLFFWRNYGAFAAVRDSGFIFKDTDIRCKMEFTESDRSLFAGKTGTLCQ